MNLVKLALIRLLPRLQASDAHLLNVEQRKSLCRALNDKSSKLVLAILKAFEQVGDAEALPYVQKLAEGKGRARTEKRIQEAAQACLPFLSRLAEQTQARQTLLRAAGTSQAAEGALLRPASGAPTTDSSQLLRTEWPSERD
ncbi:MAG TPA: hypothetical protein VFA07_07895 [Chthonomonadaceae bacterium]|nr:hypothetical protein [Chthonomonadaceae bacterium]